LQAESLPYIPSTLEDLHAALQYSSLSIKTSKDKDKALSMDIDLEWQVAYYTLMVLFKILRVFSNLAAQDDKIAWNFVSSHLLMLVSTQQCAGFLDFFSLLHPLLFYE